MRRNTIAEPRPRVGLLERVYRGVLAVVGGIVLFLMSAAVIVAVRGPIVAEFGLRRYHAVFGAWLLLTVIGIGIFGRIVRA